mgnify:CR=1 FL=1
MVSWGSLDLENTPKGMYRRMKLGDSTNDRTCDSLVDYGDNMRVEIELKFEQQNLNSLKLNGELSLPNATSFGAVYIRENGAFTGIVLNLIILLKYQACKRLFGRIRAKCTVQK